MNESNKLSVNALEAINNADLIGIPAISCWEIAMLVEKLRIGLSMDVQIWLDLALQHPNVQLLPLTPEIAVLSTQLPRRFHGDPSDRLIVASSLVHKAPLVSKIAFTHTQHHKSIDLRSQSTNNYGKRIIFLIYWLSAKSQDLRLFLCKLR
jgi:PIN domain nuclease of toxin-antitoxin system